MKTLRSITHLLMLPSCLMLLSFAAADEPTVAREEPVPDVPEADEAEEEEYSLESEAFKDGKRIPKTYTADGADVSPPLEWVRAPEGTKSFALVVEDPDAPVGNWVHWLAWNIPAVREELPEAIAAEPAVLEDIRQGTNDFGMLGYGGPAPPPGKPHRYYFRLYALDTELSLKPGAEKEALEEAMDGHILGKAELMGRYGR